MFSVFRVFRLAFFLIVWVVVCAFSAAATAQELVAVIDTQRGEIEVELHARAAPTTVANFINLARRGFYDGLTFHRVERNFMVQGGDPEGSGAGGPGYQFRGEVVLPHNRPGVLSMANSGPGTDGSQFFLTHVPTPHLNGLHSVFGVVIKGLPLVYELRRGDMINSITIRGDASAVMERKKGQLERWNATLDQAFPDLRPAGQER